MKAAEYRLCWGKHNLHLGQRTCIMGILNVTPDSFSDGGDFFDTDRAVEHGLKMIQAGADIIDIGGESTRPFSQPVDVEEEIRRVVPIIEKLSRQTKIPISIDTTKAVAAEKAFEAGASILNDISAMNFDSEMASVAAKYDVPVILMHILGTPGNMQQNPQYQDLLNEIYIFLDDARVNAVKAGVNPANIIIDPGIGFGKTLEHNLELINELRFFHKFNAPILIGPSRKSFIKNTLKQKIAKPCLEDIEIGTQAAITASILNGAHIVRVHDVAKARITADITDAILQVKNDFN